MMDYFEHEWQTLDKIADCVKELKWRVESTIDDQLKDTFVVLIKNLQEKITSEKADILKLRDSKKKESENIDYEQMWNNLSYDILAMKDKLNSIDVSDDEKDLVNGNIHALNVVNIRMNMHLIDASLNNADKTCDEEKENE